MEFDEIDKLFRALTEMHDALENGDLAGFARASSPFSIRYYVLDGDEVRRFEGDFVAWAVEVFGNRDSRRVALTDLGGGVEVSTVFLALDHQHKADGPPLLFETLVLGGLLDGAMWRYSTVPEARAGHDRAVELARVALATERRLIRRRDEQHRRQLAGVPRSGPARRRPAVALRRALYRTDGPPDVN